LYFVRRDKKVVGGVFVRFSCAAWLNLSPGSVEHYDAARGRWFSIAAILIIP
jgi:hypothetical protein